MATNNICETITRGALGIDAPGTKLPKEIAAGALTILSLACEIDRLTERVVEDARRIAENHERYARHVEQECRGVFFNAPEAPSSSLHRDLDRNVAALRANQAIFGRLFEITTGKSLNSALAAYVDAEAAAKAGA